MFYRVIFSFLFLAIYPRNYFIEVFFIHLTAAFTLYLLFNQPLSTVQDLDFQYFAIISHVSMNHLVCVYFTLLEEYLHISPFQCIMYQIVCIFLEYTFFFFCENCDKLLYLTSGNFEWFSKIIII